METRHVYGFYWQQTGNKCNPLQPAHSSPKTLKKALTHRRLLANSLSKTAMDSTQYRINKGFT